MKKFISLIVIGAMVALSGCSATPITQAQYDLQVQKETAKVSCYDRLKDRDARIASMLAKIPEDQVSLVFVLTQMQENNKQLMAIATGNSADECSTGTSVFDVQIAELKYKNDTVKSVTGSVIDLGKFGFGVWGATEISADLAHAGAKTVYGDDNSAVNSGTGNSVVEDSLKTSGEGAAISSSLPSVDVSTTHTSSNSISTPTTSTYTETP